MNYDCLHKLYRAHLALAALLAGTLLAIAAVELLLSRRWLSFTEAQGYAMMVGIPGALLVLVAAAKVLLLSGQDLLGRFRGGPSCLGPQNPALLFLTLLLLVMIPAALISDAAGISLLVAYPIISLAICIRWLAKRRASPEG